MQIRRLHRAAGHRPHMQRCACTLRPTAPFPAHRLQIRHRPSLTQKLAALYYVWAFGLGIYCWLLAFWLCGLAPALLWPALGM